MIRACDPGRDRAQLLVCIAALQDTERALEPHLPHGSDMADAYLDFLLERCGRYDGAIFVAEIDRHVAGFISILTTVPAEQPDQEQGDCAYICDLLVLPAYRKRGVGRALMEHAERFARGRGATAVRIYVLARNRRAHELYLALGFEDAYVQLVKRFSPRT